MHIDHFGVVLSKSADLLARYDELREAQQGPTGFEFVCPRQQSNRPGRPRLDISQEAISFLQSIHNSWTEVADVLGVTYRTILRRRNESGMPIANLHGPREGYSSLSDEDLRNTIREILRTLPNAGETYIIGALRTRGIIVQRYRVRDALREIDPVSRAIRRTLSIVRRQ